MLSILFIVLSIGSCHSIYSVSVTVLSGFCLDIYEGPSNTYSTQLELQFSVGYGGIQPSTYYFVTGSDPNPADHGISTFSNANNVLRGYLNPPPLVLDYPIPLLDVTQYDDLDITFDINPVIKWNGNESIVAKCNAAERIHYRRISPGHLLQNATTDSFWQVIKFDLSHTPCLTTTEPWFSCNPEVNVQLNFSCGGPCNQLSFITTTSTTYQVTTETTTKANDHDGDVDKFKFSLIAVAAVAALEFMIIIGLCVRRRLKPTSDPVERNVVEPEMYDDVQSNVMNNVTSQRQNGRPIDVNADAEDDNYAAFAMDVIIDPAHLRSLNRNQ